MKKIKRRYKVHRIMRLLNRFRKVDVAYIYISNYHDLSDEYGTEEAENYLLEIGYEQIFNEITDELFKRLKEIA